MSAFRITLEGGRTAFAPGETIAGEVAWNAPVPPGTLALRLFWYTQGKGTRDLGLAWEETLEAAACSGGRRFRVKAPDHPPSVSGKLVSICWALEVIGSGAVERVDLVIGPRRREHVLGSV